MKPTYLDQHPVLGELEPRKTVVFYYNGTPIEAREGDMVASALCGCGIKVFSHTHRSGAPRGLFCAIGHCTDCSMRVDGVDNVRTCTTKVKEGMRVESDGNNA